MSSVTRIGDRWDVDTELGKFSVNYGDDYFIHGDPTLLLGKCQPGRRAVVIDKNVFDRYWGAIQGFLIEHGCTPIPIIMEVSEENKNEETLIWLLRRLKALKLKRRSEPIIAIGGGILTDIAGCAA